MAQAGAHENRSLWDWLRAEPFLGFGIATGAIFLFFGDTLFSGLSNPLLLTLLFAWLFVAVLGCALRVVHHADILAERLGEPYGTLILTLSITAIEVMAISAVMFHGADNPTLVRDTVFSVVIILLNGLIGLSILVGAWRNREQVYNLQGANAYLGLIVPLVTLGLILPDFAPGDPDGVASVVRRLAIGLMTGGLYIAFLMMQTGRHRGYFVAEAPKPDAQPEPMHHRAGPTLPHVLLLAANMIPVVFLVEQLAHPIDFVIENMHWPAALGGLVMAILVVTPEAIGAVNAARHNHVQRSVNILLGSVLSTTGLTLPIMLLVSHFGGKPIVLGVEYGDVVVLALTMALSMITFASGRTNVLQGAVHILLFFTAILLMFD